jgi:hypothetical protein
MNSHTTKESHMIHSKPYKNSWGIEYEKKFLAGVAAGTNCCDEDMIKKVPKAVVDRIKVLEGYMVAVSTLSSKSFTAHQDQELLKVAYAHIKRLGG